MLGLYTPLTGVLGGWDQNSLADFEKAANMSGPSRFIVIPMYRLLAWVCRISPLHDRFGMDAKMVFALSKSIVQLTYKNIN
jgi:hypothetical protein